MKFRKGEKFEYLYSLTIIEVLKGNSDRINGMLKVNYNGNEIDISNDFLSRQVEFNLVKKIKPKADAGTSRQIKIKYNGKARKN